MECIILNIGFLIVNIMLTYCIIKSFLKKNRLGRYLASALICSTLVLWAYTLNYFENDEELMSVFCCLEHLLIDWALLSLLMFIYLLEGRALRKDFRLIATGLALIDSIVFFTNPINHFVGEFKIYTYEHEKFAILEPKLFYYFHVAVCLAMIALMVFSLLRKIFSYSHYYRLRYEIILWILFIVVVSDMAFGFNTTASFKYSRYLYGIAGLLIYFATYDYSPLKLMKNLQWYVDDNISDATILYDNEDKVIKVNDMAKRLFDEEALSSKENLLKILNCPDKDGKYLRAIKSYNYEVLYKPVYDKKNLYVASAFIFHDVTESTRQLEREHDAAIFDSLTKSYNRVGFLEKAPELLKEQNSFGDYAVMVSGICNFKGINGLYGTKVGDLVLKEMAKKLHNYHHEFPMLYGRTAEGKFSSILPFEYVHEIVRETSHLTITIDKGVEIQVDICHGFVVMQDMTKPVEYYYELALLALAKCKERVNTQVLEYSKGMAEEQKKRQLLLSEMHYAIEKREFFIELQPQIDLTTKKVCGAEALVRWNHPILGLIPPNDFIPLFESNIYITRLDKYVWEEAANTIAYFERERLYDGPISINVSQIDIMHMDVVSILDSIVKKYEIPYNKLHVEITESACVNNRDVLIYTMDALREMGFIVEIDDFGSGYSSLNALMHMPFDVVKLDMGFMSEDAVDKKREVIINAMSGMIHELDAKIIVEGVETLDNAESAIHFNADVAQGYHYSRPIGIEEFVKFVKEFNSVGA